MRYRPTSLPRDSSYPLCREYPQPPLHDTAKLQTDNLQVRRCVCFCTEHVCVCDHAVPVIRPHVWLYSATSHTQRRVRDTTLRTPPPLASPRATHCAHSSGSSSDPICTQITTLHPLSRLSLPLRLLRPQPQLLARLARTLISPRYDAEEQLRSSPGWQYRQ